MHYNRANNYSFVNGTEIHKFKAKDYEINPIPLCLGNISKDFSVDNMKKTGFYRYVYDFSVDYYFVAADDILDIHKYLMKKNNLMKNVWIYPFFFYVNDVYWPQCIKCESINQE